MDTAFLVNKNIDVTRDLQKMFDDASTTKETLFISKGNYLVSSLFVKKNTHIIFEEGAKLYATKTEEEYPIISTRVAGINMPFYAAVLNVIDAYDVTIEGNGEIIGAGPYFWEKYWGKDQKGGMRKIYDEQGLRWACDYDCNRVRNVLVQNSYNVSIKDIKSTNSGFWNFHILYSHDCLLDGIKVECPESPSTDGVDIDSSYNICVLNIFVKCCDDAICIKSGRDYDGQKQNLASHDILIKDSLIENGFGITIGSEISGGIYNIDIKNIKYRGTDCAFRIKSTSARKGYIKNVDISDIDALNVKYLFHLYVNWNPMYNKCEIPSDYKGEVKEYWKTLCKSAKGANSEVSNIKINNFVANISNDYNGISRVFNIEGFSDSHIKKISFNNMNIKAYELGFINYTDDISFNNCNISLVGKENKENDEYDNR